MVIQSAALLPQLTATTASQTRGAVRSAWNDALTQATVATDPAATANQGKGPGSDSGVAAATAAPVSATASPPASQQSGDATTTTAAPAPPLPVPPQILAAAADAATGPRSAGPAGLPAAAVVTGPAETGTRHGRAHAAVRQGETSQPPPVETDKSAAAAIQAVGYAAAVADLPIVPSPAPSSGLTVPGASPVAAATTAATAPAPPIAVAPGDGPPLPASPAGSPEASVPLPQIQDQALPVPVAGPVLASSRPEAAATVPRQVSGSTMRYTSVAQDPGRTDRRPQAPAPSLPADRTEPIAQAVSAPTPTPLPAPPATTATISVAPSSAVAAVSYPAPAASAASPAAQPNVVPIAVATAPGLGPQGPEQSHASGTAAVTSNPPSHDQGTGQAAVDVSHGPAVAAVRPRDDRQTMASSQASTAIPGSTGLASATALGSATSSGLAGTSAVQTAPAALPVATASSRSALSDSAIPPTPAALAATVVAMTGSGHSSTVLRLAPPDLGTLSIHVAYAADASVNLVFVPSTAQTAQLLSGGMDGLRHAMATAGLTLGQAQIGGGAGDGYAAGGGSGGFSGQRQSAGGHARETVAGPAPATMIDGQGARAIA